jgi:hypothetical protein
LKLDSLNKWLTLTANTGVLIGVALILVELNQNRQLAEAQFSLTIDEKYWAAEIAMMESDLSETWATSLSDPKSLTGAEIRSLDAFYATVINRWGNTYDLEQRGLVDDGQTARQMESAPFFFGNAFALSWWEHNREYWGAEFAELIDVSIASMDARANENWIRDMQSALEELE